MAGSISIVLSKKEEENYNVPLMMDFSLNGNEPTGGAVAKTAA